MVFLGGLRGVCGMFLLILIFLVSESQGAVSVIANLTLLENTQGAVCLDGSPPGYYFAPSTNSANQNNWMIYFQGGGWCYNAEQCLQRAGTVLGSSTFFPPSVPVDGLISLNASVSPDFAAYNHVFIQYCDGGSFSGDREEPLIVNGTALYMRGKRILDLVFATLTKELGLGEAERVLLTGGSAGGLATFLHADYVKESLLPPSVVQYGSVPGSGYFLDHPNTLGQPIFLEDILGVVEMQNLTNGVNDGCRNATSTSDQWQCFFAPWTYDYIKTPIFPINSAYDWFSMMCILSGTADGGCFDTPGWSECGNNVTACNSSQIEVMNEWRANFLANFTSSPAFTAPGNGAFIHSCVTHCADQLGSDWLGFTIGNTTMQQAVSQWWNSGFQDPAANHTYLPCELNTQRINGTYDCNPTCVNFEGFP